MAKRPTTPDEYADPLTRRLTAATEKHIPDLELLTDYSHRLSRRARGDLRTRLRHIAVAAQGYADRLADD